MARKTLRYDGETYDISYEIVHPEAERTVVFLHGWGSNKELMKQAFGKTLPGFRHLYVDLPGFGNSTSPVALETADYARIMEDFLARVDAAAPDAVVGHSFGGKVATLLDPKRLVLLSSAGIVRPKPLSVRAKIAAFKLLKSLGLARWRSFFVADDAKTLSPQMYETFKRVVDEDFRERFSAYGGPALLCWGRDDTATPLSSGEAIASLIGDSRLETFGGGHYFFLDHPAEVAAAIERELDREVR